MQSIPHPRLAHLKRLPDPQSANLSAWLDELARAGWQSSCEGLLSLFEAYLPDMRLDGPQRLELAERLRAHVVEIVESPAASIVDRRLPYLPEMDRTGILVASLQAHLGRFFLSAADRYRRPAIAESADSFDPCEAAHRALEHFGRALLVTAQLYRTPDPGFWQDVYRSLRHTADTGGHRTSPHRDAALSEFKRLVLFVLARINRFQQSEMQQIYAVLGHLAVHAELSSEPAENGRNALFGLNLASDRPPLPLSQLPARGSDTLRYLYTDRVAQILMDRSAQEQGADRPALLRKMVFRRLARSLSAPAKRGSKRLQEFGECRFAVGLSDILLALSEPRNHPDGPPAFGRSAHSRDTVGWLPISDFELFGRADRSPSESAARMVRNESAMIDWFAGNEPGNGQETRPSRGSEPQQQGRLLNSSAGGYCIAWISRRAASLRVGDLLGLPLHGAQFQIGVIRWVRSQDQQAELGIELLSPSAETVKVVAGPLNCRGLMLPAIAPIRLAPELLIPPGTLEFGTPVTIEMRGSRKRIDLAKRIEVTHSFDRFAILEP